jgi:hypothetical protein
MTCPAVLEEIFQNNINQTLKEKVKSFAQKH